MFTQYFWGEQKGRKIQRLRFIVPALQNLQLE